MLDDQNTEDKKNATLAGVIQMELLILVEPLGIIVEAILDKKELILAPNGSTRGNFYQVYAKTKK